MVGVAAVLPLPSPPLAPSPRLRDLKPRCVHHGATDAGIGEHSHPIITAALAKSHGRVRLEVPRNRSVNEEPGVGRQLLQDAYESNDDELVAALFDAEADRPGCIDMHHTLGDVSPGLMTPCAVAPGHDLPAVHSPLSVVNSLETLLSTQSLESDLWGLSGAG